MSEVQASQKCFGWRGSMILVPEKTKSYTWPENGAKENYQQIKKKLKYELKIFLKRLTCTEHELQEECTNS